jgi:hypothetical protein
MKCYIGQLEHQIGEYNVTTACKFVTDRNPKEYLDQLAKEYWGDSEKDDGGAYYANGGDLASRAGSFEEVSAEVFDQIPLLHTLEISEEMEVLK